MSTNSSALRCSLLLCVASLLAAAAPSVVRAEQTYVPVASPNKRNVLVLNVRTLPEELPRYTVLRDGRKIFGPSPVGPVLKGVPPLAAGARIVEVKTREIDEAFTLLWGKTHTVAVRGQLAVVTLEGASGIRWQIELRAHDDGVAFRCRIPKQENLAAVEITGEETTFDPAGNPTALYDALGGFTTSHEALYSRTPLAEVPGDKLLDMPVLLTWPFPDGPAAAITEARVRHFAGAYLARSDEKGAKLALRLSPLPLQQDVCVAGAPPVVSPWRVILLADRAGELLESNLLLALNDPPLPGDFSWLVPGKTNFPWWNGQFEDDDKDASGRAFGARNRAYIDFCAAHHIAYHSIHGDGRAWYKQSSTDYGVPSADADVRVPRPELHLQELIGYATSRGVGVRLWVHWKPLSEHLEEAFALYESWGVRGLMVDFLDRDDQQMVEWSEKMLDCAARHKLHIQIHGSSKPSGEQATFPNLFNREGVMNLEYLKWGDQVTPAHAVNVAYTRALAGPVDFHLGGFRAAPRAGFKPHDRSPIVLGTRCYQLALYVVYENPMPMIADSPDAYEGQPGFDFLEEVPTTWDETHFVAGEPGEYLVLARRKGAAWYLAGITNWTPRKLSLPLEFLRSGKFTAKIYADGSLDESRPNEVRIDERPVDAVTSLDVDLASGGGFVAILAPR